MKKQKTIKLAVVITGLLLSVSLSSIAQATRKNTGKKPSGSALENRVIDSVMKIAEVKELSKNFERQYKGKRHIQYMVAEYPSKKSKYYWVKVMEDHPDNYVTDFTFLVEPKTFEIKYYDVVHDTVINMETWRKNK